jgi:hypothetical protein
LSWECSQGHCTDIPPHALLLSPCCCCPAAAALLLPPLLLLLLLPCCCPAAAADYLTKVVVEGRNSLTTHVSCQGAGVAHCSTAAQQRASRGINQHELLQLVEHGRSLVVAPGRCK